MEQIQKEINLKVEKIEKIEDEICGDQMLIFDAHDPMDSITALRPEEEDRLIQVIRQEKKKKETLEKEIMELICKKNPSIANSNLLKNIQSHEMKYLLYNLINRCPSLLQNEQNLQIIISTLETSHNKENMQGLLQSLSPSILNDEHLQDFLNREYNRNTLVVLCSDTLADDKEIVDMIREEDIRYDWGMEDIQTMENILEKIPHVSRELLLNCNSKYLRQNIHNDKVMNDLLLIFNLYQEQKNNDGCFLKGSTLSQIFEILENENPYFITDMNVMDKLKISILLYSGDEQVISHFEEISKIYVTYTPIIIIAFLQAPSTEYQDKLLQFLLIGEVRKNVVNKGFYYSFLVEQMNQLDIDMYGNIKSIFTNVDEKNADNNIQETLLHYFDKENLEYIYFYDEKEQICKTPVTFYQQFLQSVFFGGYLDLMAREHAYPNFLYNEAVIWHKLENEYVETAQSILQHGIHMSLDYNINKEIYWNEIMMTCEEEEVSKDDFDYYERSMDKRIDNWNVVLDEYEEYIEDAEKVKIKK